MLKINTESVRSYIQWLGLVNDNRMESDRGLIREETSCNLVKKYVSSDKRFEVTYSCGMLVYFVMDDIMVSVHMDTDDNGDPINVTFSAWNQTTLKESETYEYDEKWG